MTIRHKQGLGLLFLTEMWERFSFYSLRALLVLYMVAHASEGGMGWSQTEALQLYAWYIGAAYTTPILGGYLSDNFLGQRRSAMIGAWMMALGHFCMALNSLFFFYLALSLVALGNGFFKPCLTSILGQLYDDANESQRDAAYSLFYMGINLGGFLAGIISGLLMKHYGYDLGFAVAGFGMLLALLIFWWGKERYLGDAGAIASKKTVAPHPLTKEEKKRFLVIGFICFLTVYYYMAWEQMGGLITLFIDSSVDRTIGTWEIPTPWLASVDPGMIFFLAPFFTWLWTYLGEKGKDPFVGIKMGTGLLITGFAFLLLVLLSQWAELGYKPHWSWIVLYKLLIVIGELAILPISWAAVTALSPPAYISRSMAASLASIGIGSFLAGRFGAYAEAIGQTTVFSVITVGLFLLGALCVALNNPLKRLAGHSS